MRAQIALLITLNHLCVCQVDVCLFSAHLLTPSQNGMKDVIKLARPDIDGSSTRDGMKFLLRVMGIWLLGLTLVLLVIDGTRSLAASQLAITPSGEIWAGLHAQSLVALQIWATNSLAPNTASFIVTVILAWPGWAITGAPGIALLILGRQKNTPSQFINT